MYCLKVSLGVCLALISITSVFATEEPQRVASFRRLMSKVLGSKIPNEDLFIQDCTAVHQQSTNAATDHQTVKSVLNRGAKKLTSDCDELYERTTVAQGCAKKTTIGENNLPAGDSEWWHQLTNSLANGSVGSENPSSSQAFKKFCQVVTELRDRVKNDPDECGGRPAKPKETIYKNILTHFSCKA